MRLGEVHGAGPLAGHHLRQVGLLQVLAALQLDGVDGAECEQRTQAEREVGRVPDLAGCRRHQVGQVLAAPFFRRLQAAPAARGELLVGFLPAGRRDHLAVHQLGAGAIAHHAQGIEHLGAELAGFLHDGADGVLVHTDDAAFDQAIQPRGRLQRLHDVVDRSLIGHAFLLPGVDVCGSLGRKRKRRKGDVGRESLGNARRCWRCRQETAARLPTRLESIARRDASR